MAELFNLRTERKKKRCGDKERRAQENRVAFGRTGALLDYDFREVKVARAIIENARHVILVADRTKSDRSAPVRTGHLSQVNSLCCRPVPQRQFASDLQGKRC